MSKRSPCCCLVLFNFPLTRVLYLAWQKACSKAGHEPHEILFSFHFHVHREIITVNAQMRVSVIYRLCLHSCIQNLHKQMLPTFISLGWSCLCTSGYCCTFGNDIYRIIKIYTCLIRAISLLYLIIIPVNMLSRVQYGNINFILLYFLLFDCIITDL